MQISCLYDKYWIHDNFSVTQTHSILMLVKTLAKLNEHVVQHPFAPLQAKPLQILFSLKVLPRRWWRSFGPPLHARTRSPLRTCGIVRLRRFFGPLQCLSAASLSPVAHFQSVVCAWNGDPSGRRRAEQAPNFRRLLRSMDRN